jgi:hypothetical protein
MNTRRYTDDVTRILASTHSNTSHELCRYNDDTATQMAAGLQPKQQREPQQHGGAANPCFKKRTYFVTTRDKIFEKRAPYAGNRTVCPSVTRIGCGLCVGEVQHAPKEKVGNVSNWLKLKSTPVV